MPLRNEKERATQRSEEERRIARRVRYKEVSLGVGWKSRIAVERGAEGGDSSADLGILGNFWRLALK